MLCPVQQQRLCDKHCDALGALGWWHLARSVPGQLHTPSAKSWGPGWAGQGSLFAGLCQQLISRGSCCQASPWSILPWSSAMTLGERPLLMLCFTCWLLILRPLAVPLMKLYGKSISRVSLCVSNLKRIYHASNYELKVSFHLLLSVHFLTGSLSLENQLGPSEMNRIFHVGNMSCIYLVLILNIQNLISSLQKASRNLMNTLLRHAQLEACLRCYHIHRYICTYTGTYVCDSTHTHTYFFGPSLFSSLLIYLISSWWKVHREILIKSKGGDSGKKEEKQTNKKNWSKKLKTHM